MFPRAQCWVPSCIPCTPHLSQTSSVNTTWTIIFMLMIAKFICLSSRVLLANRLHPNCALSHAFTMLTIGCQPISWCSITTKLSSLFCTPDIDHNPPQESILVCSDVIYSSNSAKNIGAWFDTVMSMDKQINSKCQSVFYHLRNIAKNQ